jgi:hypothetical protein
MSSVWMEFRNGGWANLIILLLGGFGTTVAVVALALTGARSRAARLAGVAAVLVAALTGGMGVVGVWLGHSMTNRALEGGAVQPSMVERIRREGYKESKSCAKFGVGFALLPLLAGAIGVLAGPRGRRIPEAPPPPGAFGMNVTPAGDPEGSGMAAGLGALAVAALVLASDAVLIAQPLPGRERSPFEYELLDAKETIDDGDLHRGCVSLERALTDQGSLGPAPQEVDVAALSATCADGRLAEIGKEPPAAQRADLATLSKSPLLDPVHQKTVADQLAALGPPSSPADRFGDATKDSSPTINGRLPPEIIQRIVRQHFPQMKRCYNTGLAANPKLEGRVVVRFVIGRDGNVLTAMDGDSDLPDKTVRACVVAAFQALSFPQPEGGIVTVVYPVVFKAS